MPSRLNQLMTEELKHQFHGVTTCVFVDFTGLSGRKAADLRHRLEAQGAGFTVVKRTIAKLAFRETTPLPAGQAELLDRALEGPTAVAYGGDDPVLVVRLLDEWSKKESVLRLKGGLLDGRPLSADDVAALARIPPKNVLMAQVVGTIAAPLSGLMSVAQGPIRKLMALANALAKKLSEQ